MRHGHGVGRSGCTVIGSGRWWTTRIEASRNGGIESSRPSSQSHASDGGLRLTAPDRPAIEIGPPGARSTTVKSHFGVPVPACDAGDEAAAWFSDLTGEAVRLVAMVSECGWRLPDDLDVFGQNAPFSDAAPVLVTADSSLTWLCERASEPFGMDRFRPNLVVSNTDGVGGGHLADLHRR